MKTKKEHYPLLAFGVLVISGAFADFLSWIFDALADLDVLHGDFGDFVFFVFAVFAVLDKFPFNDFSPLRYRLFDSLQKGDEVGSSVSGSPSWSGIGGKVGLAVCSLPSGFGLSWREVGTREDDWRTRVIWWCTPLVPLNVVVNVCEFRGSMKSGYTIYLISIIVALCFRCFYLQNVLSLCLLYMSSELCDAIYIRDDN